MRLTQMQLFALLQAKLEMDKATARFNQFYAELGLPAQAVINSDSGDVTDALVEPATAEEPASPA